MSSASILGPAGAIAQRLSNYESRVQQLDMANAVAQAKLTSVKGLGRSYSWGAYLGQRLHLPLFDSICENECGGS